MFALGFVIHPKMYWIWKRNANNLYFFKITIIKAIFLVRSIEGKKLEIFGFHQSVNLSGQFSFCNRWRQKTQWCLCKNCASDRGSCYIIQKLIVSQGQWKMHASLSAPSTIPFISRLQLKSKNKKVNTKVGSCNGRLCQNTQHASEN